MLKIEDPVIESVPMEFAVNLISRKKCINCGNRLDFQVECLLEKYIQRQSGDTNYVKYLNNPDNKTIVNTTCLRIDFQSNGNNLNNIQMQLGGSRCYIDRRVLRKTTCAAIQLEGPPSNLIKEIGYRKDRVKNAFRESFLGWQFGQSFGKSIKNKEN